MLKCLEDEVSCLQLTFKLFNNKKGYLFGERRTEKGGEGQRKKAGKREGRDDQGGEQRNDPNMAKC